jgi:hypothetical protein
VEKGCWLRVVKLQGILIALPSTCLCYPRLSVQTTGLLHSLQHAIGCMHQWKRLIVSIDTPPGPALPHCHHNNSSLPKHFGSFWLKGASGPAGWWGQLRTRNMHMSRALANFRQFAHLKAKQQAYLLCASAPRCTIRNLLLACLHPEERNAKRG